MEGGKTNKLLMMFVFDVFYVTETNFVNLLESGKEPRRGRINKQTSDAVCVCCALTCEPDLGAKQFVFKGKEANKQTRNEVCLFRKMLRRRNYILLLALRRRGGQGGKTKQTNF